MPERGDDMSDSYEFENNARDDMGSVNHGLTQARLAAALIDDERFSVVTELSLDISKFDLGNYGIEAKDEIKPGVCLYPSSIDLREFDVVKMTDMPLLAMEILSPSQGIPELKRKIHAFFELGVKSCWLVIPDVKTIYVYSQPTEYGVFAMDDTQVVDEVMDIRLPIAKVFGRREVRTVADN